MIDVLKVQKFLNQNYPLDSGVKLKENEFDQNMFMYVPLAFIKTMGLPYDCSEDEFNKKFDNALNNLSVGTSSPLVPLIRVQIALSKMFAQPAPTSLSLFSTNLMTVDSTDNEDYGNQVLDKDLDLNIRDLVKWRGFPDMTPLKNVVKAVFHDPVAPDKDVKGDFALRSVANSINYTISSNYACRGFYSEYGNMDNTGTGSFDELLPYFAAKYQANANKPVTGELVHSDFLGEYQSSTWGKRTSNAEFLIRWLLYLKGYTFELSWNNQLIEDLHKFVADEHVNFYFQDNNSMWNLISALIKQTDKASAYTYKNAVHRYLKKHGVYNLDSLEFDVKAPFTTHVWGVDEEVSIEISHKKDEKSADESMPYDSTVQGEREFSIENGQLEFTDSMIPTVNTKLSDYNWNAFKDVARKATNKLGITTAMGTVRLFLGSDLTPTHFNVFDEVGVEIEYNVSELLHQETTRPFVVTLTITWSIDNIIKRIREWLKKNHDNHDDDHGGSQGTDFDKNNIKNDIVGYSALGLILVLNDIVGDHDLTLYPTRVGHYQANGNQYSITAEMHNAFSVALTDANAVMNSKAFQNTLLAIGIMAGTFAIGIAIGQAIEGAAAIAGVLLFLSSVFYAPQLVS